MEVVAAVLEILGGIVLAITVLRMVLIGIAHQYRSGAAPLTPSFRPMASDLMEKMGTTLKLGLFGGVLLAAGWAVGKWWT